MERARPPMPQVEGSTVHLIAPHLITFKHDPRAANREEQQLAGVRKLANAAIAEHGGKVNYDLEKHPTGVGWNLVFKKLVVKKQP